jgi:hypothetical protein
MRNWFSSRLVDSSGKIPTNVRANELEFAKTLPKNESLVEDWIARGPYNVGGRTRAMALDVNNENVIMAGGVSGGVWRTEDLGANWTKLTSNEMLHNVTCLKQDTRTNNPENPSTWYYGTLTINHIPISQAKEVPPRLFAKLFNRVEKSVSIGS